MFFDIIKNPIPAVPNTGWYPPMFPNLSAVKTLSVDVKTWDPNASKYGPGWSRSDGHVIGVSLCADGEAAWYFPVRHAVEPEYNIPPEKVFPWLSEILGDDRPKVGAGLLHGVGWLRDEGVFVRGQLYDIQNAEALLSETEPVNFEALALKYIGQSVDYSYPYDWCARAYGGAADKKQEANFWRCSPRIVGPFIEKNALLPVKILERQWPLLDDEGLLPVFDMETRLIPCLLEMRRRGVTIDIEKAEQISRQLKEENQGMLSKIWDISGSKINPNSSDDIAKIFNKMEIAYPRTETGQPSFSNELLRRDGGKFGSLLADWRERDRLVSTFIDSLLECQVNGRVHCLFHQLRGDGVGSRSGRLSSSMPSLQNIPIRSNLGKIVRDLFIPDNGDVFWRSYDYSQIEYRFLAHFARGHGSDEIRDAYRKNPKIDFHNKIIDLIYHISRLQLERRDVKTVNFGLCYGMGKIALARNLGVSRGDADRLFSAYHSGAPFVHETARFYQDAAEREGFVTTIMGRKSRFPIGKCGMRDGTYKALNRVLQGSSADLTKMAMVIGHESGLFSTVGYPRITVHDELDFSDPGGVDKEFEEIQRIMETALSLQVPLVVEGGTGATWGAAH